MVLSDLRTGMVVTTKNNNIFMVFRDTCGEARLVRDGGRLFLGGYNNDLSADQHKISDSWDIVAVYTTGTDYLPNISHTRGFTKIWEKIEVKEMTVADVEKLVGCKVKIVK